jgi:hypothetical protein
MRPSAAQRPVVLISIRRCVEVHTVRLLFGAIHDPSVDRCLEEPFLFAVSSAPQSVGGERVIRIAGIHKIGTGGAQQYGRTQMRKITLFSVATMSVSALHRKTTLRSVGMWIGWNAPDLPGDGWTVSSNSSHVDLA